jgi:ELWxxDGT repeat protein
MPRSWLSPLFASARSPQRRPLRRAAAPRLEILEDRTLLSVALLKDISPDVSPGSDPSSLVVVNGTLFFAAGAPNYFNPGDGNGRELWKSNGTAAGTVLVKDINPGRNSSNPLELTNVNGTLFFTADNGTSIGQLWKSNGTAAGTVRVKPDVTFFPSRLTNVNGTLFFTTNDGFSGIGL